MAESAEEDGTWAHLALQPLRLLGFPKQTSFADLQLWGYANLDMKNKHHLAHLTQITAGMNKNPFNIIQNHAIYSAFR